MHRGFVAHLAKTASLGRGVRLAPAHGLHLRVPRRDLEQALTLKSLPVGIAYAVWSGLGIVLVSIAAWYFYGQKLDAWGYVGIAFILAGVLILNLLSKSSAH